jgi:hypothetical protein
MSRAGRDAQYLPRGTHRDHTATETALVAATGLLGPRLAWPTARSAGLAETCTAWSRT